jgi:hypothetical protein
VARVMMNRGYFSVVRWATDATRDEAKNVAVILVDAEGQFGGLRSAPPSAIGGNLRDQGLLDSLMQGLRAQFDSDDKPDLRNLQALQANLNRSLYLTEPKAVAVSDTGATLKALYRAFVAPKSAPRSATKGVVLDEVATTFRKWGLRTELDQYVDDYLFDAVVAANSKPTVVEVLSFATGTRDWSIAERDAGHFVFAVDRTGLPAAAVVKPPTDASKDTAEMSYGRVVRWFDRAQIPTVVPDRIEDLHDVLLRHGK